MINLIVSIVVLVGGILGMVGVKAGGGLALAGGLVWLLGMFLIIFEVEFIICNISLFYVLPSSLPYIEVLYCGIIEISLAIVGGIVILASSKE